MAFALQMHSNHSARKQRPSSRLEPLPDGMTVASASAPSSPAPLARQARHLRAVARRLILAGLTLFLVSILIFAATQALPGDPARAILGQGATAEQVEQLQAELGLDRPLVEQYTSWLGGLLRGDLGISLQNRQPVTELVGERAVASMILVGITALIAVPFALVAGIAAATHRDRRFDRGVQAATLGITALPEFVIGLLLVALLSTTLIQLLPAVAVIPPGDSPLAHPDRLALPVLTLTLAVLPYLTRLVRGSMIEALESQYVQMARLKGLTERVILWRHALPNAMVPAVQATALTLAYLTGGVVVVEFLFSYPGLGTVLTEAVAARNLPVIQIVVLAFAASYLAFNLLADLATVMLTPRLRVGA